MELLSELEHFLIIGYNMRPSLQPRKQILQPNKEADETIRKLHKKDVKFINRYLEKIRFFVNKLEKNFNSWFNSVNKEEIRYPENGVNRNYDNEYDKEQLKENLIRLEEKFCRVLIFFR